MILVINTRCIAWARGGEEKYRGLSEFFSPKGLSLQLIDSGSSFAIQ